MFLYKSVFFKGLLNYLILVNNVKYLHLNVNNYAAIENFAIMK